MRTPRVRYAAPPELDYEAPRCGNCCVSVDFDDDGWICPVCLTTWGSSDYEQPGTAYPDWSGEQYDPEMPVTSGGDGLRIGMAYERENRDAYLKSMGIGAP